MLYMNRVVSTSVQVIERSHLFEDSLKISIMSYGLMRDKYSVLFSLLGDFLFIYYWRNYLLYNISVGCKNIGDPCSTGGLCNGSYCSPSKSALSRTYHVHKLVNIITIEVANKTGTVLSWKKLCICSSTRPTLTLMSNPTHRCRYLATYCCVGIGMVTVSIVKSW